MVTTNAYRLLALPLAATLAFAAFGAVPSGVAFADDEAPELIYTEPTELQQRVEASAAAYNQAVAELEDLQARIDENGKRIAKIEKALPKQQEKADTAIVSMYKLSENGSGIADVLMGMQDFDDLMTMIDYLSGITTDNLDAIAELQALREDLADAESRLRVEKAQAEQAVEDAERTLAEAQAAREEAAAAAQAEIEAMREQIAAQAAEEALAQAVEQGATEEEAQQQAESARESAAAAVDANGVDWSMDKDAFVDEWSDRIDEYLDGSPMEGQGSNFASAAWDYGVDPRWSPAIANTESTKGQYTFADYNAWGWGSASWDSWEEAINDHVKGLADGYGQTISQESAEKYCPPNADSWYTDTLNEMNRM